VSWSSNRNGWQIESGVMPVSLTECSLDVLGFVQPKPTTASTSITHVAVYSVTLGSALSLDFFPFIIRIVDSLAMAPSSFLADPDYGEQ
jgi:hypothetical protein